MNAHFSRKFISLSESEFGAIAQICHHLTVNISRYQETYQSIADKRKEIIAGEYEPTESEATFKSDDEEDVDEDDALMQERLKAIKSLPQYDESVKGEAISQHNL